MSTTENLGETLPNPYRFTVSVVPAWPLGCGIWSPWIKDSRGGGYVTGRFPTREEADTHAALILAALHEAVME